MTYTKTGPFVDNSPPGINFAFLNNVENWISGVDAPTITTITGGTSGTATCYQFLSGSIKAIYIDCENFKTGVSNQAWTIPVPFTVGALFVNGNITTYSFYHSGSTLNCDIFTSLSSSGGSTTSVPGSVGNSIGTFIHPFDQISFNGSAGSSHTGYILMFGI